MRVIEITKLVYSDPMPKTSEEGRAKHERLLADLNAPIYLGDCRIIDYDHKSDRYAAMFIPGESKKLNLKVPGDVAAFLTEHMAHPGYWLGRMDDGLLVDVYLIQA